MFAFLGRLSQQQILIPRVSILAYTSMYSFAGYKSKVEPINHWKIIKGDKVAIIAGKDKGKSGTVTRVLRRQNKLLVQGINLKLQRVDSQKEENQLGGVRQITKPIHLSNVALIDPSTGKATRIQLAYTEEGKKVRVSKSTGTIIEKPVDPALDRTIRHKNKQDGLKDTPPSLVTQVSYKGEDFAAIKAEFLAQIQKKEEREKLLVFPN